MQGLPEHVLSRRSAGCPTAPAPMQSPAMASFQRASQLLTALLKDSLSSIYQCLSLCAALAAVILCLEVHPGGTHTTESNVRCAEIVQDACLSKAHESGGQTLVRAGVDLGLARHGVSQGLSAADWVHAEPPHYAVDKAADNQVCIAIN